MRRVFAAAAAAVLLVAVHAPVLAVSPQTWRQREKADFEKGEPQGVALGADGALRLSPRLETLYETGQPYIWALAAGRDGALYAAGGNDGAVWRIGGAGKGRILAKLPAPEVHALAADAAGNVYAGTAPDGRVHKILPDGRIAWTFDGGEKYIWALVLDRRGYLYAGTGLEGRILEIDPSGKGRVFFDSTETHIRSLALDRDGNLIAGSDGHGLVYRISPRGEGFVLYDAPLNEIAALAVSPKGAIYAAAVGEPGRAARPERPSPPPPPSPAAQGEAAPSPTPPPQESQAPAPAEQRVPIGMEGRVLAISEDGYGREVWSGTQEGILSLAFTRAGTLLLGSSVQGRIYALDRDEDDVTEIVRVPSAQVTALLSVEGDVAYGGSNFGTVGLLRQGYAASGTFDSRVLDAKAFATWGRATWRGETPGKSTITVQARCGNTEDPDRTWSAWGAPLPSGATAPIDCPAARFLQWRATLKSGDPGVTPALREVAITYQQANLPPEIRKVEVQPDGVAFQRVPPQAGNPESRTAPSGAADVDGGVRRRPKPQSRRTFEPGARTVNWQASDPNDDDLVYDVFYRAVDETAWKRVRTRIDEDFATLDSAALPDGTYLFRVVASDAPSNLPGKALQSEQTSPRFDVDNTPPRVEEIKAQAQQGGAVRLTFATVDGASILREVAYAVDAGDWVLAPAADGLLDSSSERHDLTIAALGRGEHSIVIRAVDAAGNTGAGRSLVTVP